MTTKFEYTVSAPDIAGAQSFIATVSVPVSAPAEQSRILQYLRGMELKRDLTNGWARTNAPNYGMATRGGPRPVFEDKQDRDSKVVAYEIDFQFTRGI